MEKLRDNSLRRRLRTRSSISGTTERPRLNVSITNQHITAQIVDDTQGVTLAYVTTVKNDVKGTMTEKAGWVGEKIAEAAAGAKVKSVVFDRGPRIYHGRLHALAEAARAKGLEF